MIKEKIKFNCGWCGKQNEVVPSNYHSRMLQSRSGLLFCGGSKCSAAHRSNVIRSRNILKGENLFVPKEPTVPSVPIIEPVADDWFETFEKQYKNQFYSSSNSFIGGSLVTTDNPIAGEFNSNFQEMAMNIAEIIARHPELVALEHDEFLEKLKEFTEEEEPVAEATPIVKPKVVTNPVVSNDNKLITPRVRENVASRWQDSLNNKDKVTDCDADFWDAERTMKKCNFHPVEKTYKYCVIDDQTSEIDFTSRPCYRCQGKGYLTEANLGYNYDSDMKRNIIASSMTWEGYLSQYTS